MIHQQESHSVIPKLQTAQQVQRGAARVGSQDAVAVLVALFQIAFDGVENVWIVIHRQYDWLVHL
jgi:hypothetical protein